MAKLLPVGLAAGAVAALALWLTGGGRAHGLTERVPDTDTTGLAAGGVLAPSALPGTLIGGDGVAVGPDSPLYSLSWPRFRGAHLDNVSTEPLPLSRDWGREGPKVLWSVSMGEGYAGPAVLNGRVYVLDYDQQRQGDALLCLSLADGKEIWRRWYPNRILRQHGMSRTVPAVTEKYVVTLGPKCHVMCVDAASGEYRWGLDLVNEFKTEVPQWNAGQCPLIDGSKAIIAPGAKTCLMLAVDCQTGSILWRTSNPRRWQMTHSSIVPMELAGRRMYVYCGSGGVVGVAADDGKALWEYEGWKVPMANIPTPVIVGDGRIFLTGGYNAGSMMLQVKDAGGKFVAEPIFRHKAKVFDSPQHAPILYKEHLYSVRSDGQLACMDLEGKVLWASGTAHRFGLGPFLIADGMILAMNDEGVLTVAEATSEDYRQLAQAAVWKKPGKAPRSAGPSEIADGQEAWGPMALVGGRLIVRDLTRMVCLDLRAQ